MNSGPSGVAHVFRIHPANPQARLIRRAAETVRAGGVIAYPTASCYALGRQLSHKRRTSILNATREAPKRLRHRADSCSRSDGLGADRRPAWSGQPSTVRPS
jgi:tRNA A37 threonylcarbamoyladenosine synthetase subunit TsaC/SUA5/YrdC